MGKTPKSKNVNYRSKSHLQPKVAQHRPKNYGAEKLSFPGKSEHFAPAERRMKLSGTLSRKPTKGKGFSIKVNRGFGADNEKKQNLEEMSAATVEVSESTKLESKSVILENGKEDSQEIVDKDSPSMSNGSEVEVSEESKTEVDEKANENTQDGNSAKEAEASVENNSTNSVKDDEGEMKKQRSGTPQSRSSTPQRKSGRIRTKQASPTKSTPTNQSTPALKILKINITPCQSINGTVSAEKHMVSACGDSVRSNKNVAEEQKEVDHGAAMEKEINDAQASDKEVENQIITEKEKPNQDSDTPYLRSLRLISGRRSLSRSPYSYSESYTVSSSQSKKKLSRRKDGTHMKDNSEADSQDTEIEFYTSTISGKRKAERIDDQASTVAVSSLKKPKSEDDELRLYLCSEGEAKRSFEKDLGVSELVDDFLMSSTSKQSSSENDEMEELKLSEKDESVTDESMEFGYEAKEVYVNSLDSPTANNQSSNKRWCVLM